MKLEEEAELLAQMGVDSLPASKQRIENYRLAQIQDPICSMVINFCKNGWPVRTDKRDPELGCYWQERGNLTLRRTT